MDETAEGSHWGVWRRGFAYRRMGDSPSRVELKVRRYARRIDRGGKVSVALCPPLPTPSSAASSTSTLTSSSRTSSKRVMRTPRGSGVYDFCCCPKSAHQRYDEPFQAVVDWKRLGVAKAFPRVLWLEIPLAIHEPTRMFVRLKTLQEEASFFLAIDEV